VACCSCLPLVRPACDEQPARTVQPPRLPSASIYRRAVLEGYGLTETSCLVCLTPPGDPKTGHVGPPSPACEVGGTNARSSAGCCAS
jgi:acyl-CoA synthetase (AMP-forming)/AMP-acid ligase II